jgi:hypothetical protein
MAFGVYPLVSLADARARLDEAYTILCEGRDPSVAKKLKIEAVRQTFERVTREWHENAKAICSTGLATTAITCRVGFERPSSPS